MYEIDDGNGGVRRLLYDGDALVAEYNTSGTMLDRYVHGLSAGDDPLVRYAGSGTSYLDAEYLYTDRLGSVIARYQRDGTPVAALGAGGHLDPAGTGRHGEPWGDGHLGDLPPLYVAADGSASMPVLAPRLTLADVRGRSLMVHAGGDNHADHPQPLGGGGARVACGVIAP